MSMTRTPGIGRHSAAMKWSLLRGCAFTRIKKKAQTLRRSLRSAFLSQSRPSIGSSFIHRSETVVWDQNYATFESRLPRMTVRSVLWAHSRRKEYVLLRNLASGLRVSDGLRITPSR
jgi:hypothetical protein